MGLTLGAAQDQLDKRDGFLPFGATVSSAGEQALFMVDASDEAPDAADLIERSWAALAARRSDCRCAALATDVHLPEAGTDAIRVDMEHVEGIAITVLLPYTRNRRRGVSYGDLGAEPGTFRVFVS